MKHQFYFEDSHDENCYSLDYFIEKAEEEIKELILYPAIPERISGTFWCKMHAFCGDDTTDTCGKQCKEYDPRNGKSGCCKNHSSWLYYHGEPIKINLPTNN